MKGGYIYKVVKIASVEDVEEILNKQGREGWKLVVMLPSDRDNLTFVMEKYLETIF